jgi:hypothetical protein
LAIDRIDRRLFRIEEAIKAKAPETKSAAGWLTLITASLGSWPLLALFLVFWFSLPINAILAKIPKRLESAQEFAVMGFSFKGQLETAAQRIGDGSLSATIPSLSSVAIEMLFLAPSLEPNTSSGLITKSYKGESGGPYTSIETFNEEAIRAIYELKRHGLVDLKNDSTPEEFKEELDAFRRKHPAKETRNSSKRRVELEFFEAPKTEEGLPKLSWAKTQLGDSAVAVIAEAVQAELNKPTTSGTSGR